MRTIKEFEVAVAEELGWDHNVTRHRIYRYKRQGVIPNRRLGINDVNKTVRLLDVVRVLDIQRVDKQKLWDGEIVYMHKGQHRKFNIKASV